MKILFSSVKIMFQSNCLFKIFIRYTKSKNSLIRKSSKVHDMAATTTINSNKITL